MGAKVQWPTAFDFINLCSGWGKTLDLQSETVAEICRQFAASRDLHNRCPNFRASFGSKRALGWVPFRHRTVQVDGACVKYRKREFRFWRSREIIGDIRTGNFVEDARGRWYVSFQCNVDGTLPTGTKSVGIDLGLKSLATCSDGHVVPALQHRRRHQVELGKAQTANNKRRVQAIHAKIANARRHHHHEITTRIARENELIVVGNISPSKLAKTRMAKSIFDAGWTMLRSQLAYKARRHGARYVEVSERLTSQTCSDCGAVSGPKGIAGLGVRHWECGSCGASHDRDVNAANNILRVGAERCPPAVEIAG